VGPLPSGTAANQHISASGPGTRCRPVATGTLPRSAVLPSPPSHTGVVSRVLSSFKTVTRLGPLPRLERGSTGEGQGRSSALFNVKRQVLL